MEASETALLSHHSPNTDDMRPSHDTDDPSYDLPCCRLTILHRLTALLRIVTMLTELHYVLSVLQKYPIMVDTGQYQPKYQNRTYQDMENQIARDLANAPNYTAKVKLVNGGEYVIRTKPAAETLTGDALAERIEAIKRHMRALGYTRHYTEVQEEIKKRQEHLLGVGDTLDEDAADDGYEPDDPPDTFTLD
jgi:hypothetical protein